MITIEVQSTRAVIRSQEPLTVGLRGAKVHFNFGQDWENLTKTAVFRQGERTVTLADVKQEAVIPWEVLTVPGVPVQIGIYGIGEDKAIPTLWTTTQPVRPGADPQGDPSAEPTPGLWEQMQSQLRAMEEAVAEVQEQPRSLIVTVIQQPDGTYIADCDPEQIKQAVEDQWILGCYWYDKDMMLSLSAFQPIGPYTFTAVYDATEYRVLISQSGDVTCSETDLCDSSVKVTVTEQSDGTYTADLSHEQLLEAYNNGKILFCLYHGKIMPLVVASKPQMVFGCIHSERIYTVTVGINRITATDTPMVMEVPVTSVNGKTGDVMLPTSMTVTVTEQSDGSYTADLSHEQLLEAYNNGAALFCKCGGKILSLIVANKSQMVFGCVYTGHIYTATVGISRVSVSTTALASSEEGVLYTPQALTPEQQAQARQNIGACDEEYVNQAIENIDLPTGGSGYEKIIDFKTTERVTSFDIPLNKTMMEKLKAADSIVLSLRIPRDTEDTETTTIGTVTCYVYLTWLLGIGKDKVSVIPTPTTAWHKTGFVKIEQHALQTAINDVCVTHTAYYMDNGVDKTINHTSGIVWTRHLDVNATRHYLRIEGTQNMAAGTRFVVEAKA